MGAGAGVTSLGVRGFAHQLVTLKKGIVAGGALSQGKEGSAGFVFSKLILKVLLKISLRKETFLSKNAVN